MFMTDVHRKEEIRNLAVKHLRKYGIKYRGKTTRNAQVAKTKKLFKVPIQSLENETVTLKNGQQLIIPKRLHEMCSYILTKVDTEGIFRKEGSKSRQNEIKLSLDRGCMLGNEHHVIDVAVILKCFLRELPEPLIPYSFHELYLRCSLLENKTETLLLSCLLLPTEHLNILSYLMQFLNEVASFSKFNRMNSYNISVILGPNIFPVNEKVAPKNKLMVKKTCDIIKFMIDNANNIGLIPDFILEQIANLKTGNLNNSDKVKRRRSGSLTRIFNGLKKMVTTRTEPENVRTPDLLLIQPMPPSQVETVPPKKNLLERRWSAITSASTFKRKKRESFIYKPTENSNSNSPNRTDYVRVSKTEYEEIKNRVSAIEKRLSREIENAQSTVVHNEVNIIHDIQSAYEKTLGQSQQMSPGTDQLAKRLSRELRIRNSEQKIIRSPSARKIGTIRRRSREGERPPKVAVARNPSFDHLRNYAKPNSLTRSVSSPVKNNIQIKTNIFTPTLQVGAKTRVSFEPPYSSPSNNDPSEDKSSPRHRCRSRERRAVRRSGNVTPKRPVLKQRMYNFDGHRIIEISEDIDFNKENNLEEKSSWTPSAVPHIKRGISLGRSPKRLCVTPRGSRVNTPLRVLPNAKFNVLDL